MQELVRIENIEKKYKNNSFYSLKGISFNIYKGEKFGIFGPNGAGKTTLISALCGTQSNYKGSILYKYAAEYITVSAMKENIGYVPQDFAFHEELSVWDNLQYYGAIYGLNRIKKQEKIHELMGMMQLEEFKNRKLLHCSGGIKRRVNLAIALLHDPKILFLDEPTVGIDIDSKMGIMQYLENLNKKGMTIVYTSHELHEGEAFCNRVILLNQGKIVLEGKLPTVLKENKVHNLEALFLKSIRNEKFI